MTALPPDVVADLRQENARLQAELRASRDRQAGSAEILRAIAGTSGDAERALQQIAETSARLFGAPSVSLRIAGNGEWVRVFRVGASAERVRSAVPTEKIPIGGRNLPGTVVHQNRQIHIPDLDNLDPEIADWPGLPPARAAGTRVMAGTPLRRDGKAFGVLIIYRDRPVPFTAEELALQQSFADQAVIAIENARLFNETRETLERQTATADILKVIASSPSDVQPVFEAIATSAKKLIGGFSAVVFRFVDSVAHVAAFTPTNLAADQLLKASFPRPVAEFPPFEQALAGGVVQVPDTEAEPDAQMKQLARARGFRSALNAPLMSKETPLGLIVVTRENPGSFADHHVQLLQTFADQAVIAIENTRLFNETREALAQQTATSEVLRVISSSVADTAPVFEKILDSCENLFATEQLGIFLVQPDGQTHVGAWRGAAFEAVIGTFPKPVEQTATGLAIKNRNIVYVPDSATMPDMPAAVLAVKERIGDFSIVWAPMLGEHGGVGAISAMRQPPSPFSEKELALLSTFADQAVIAIQNSRLFNETRDALERQTATADILKVIASSPSDVQPVFEAIATSSNRLIGGFSTAVFRFVDGVAHLAAFTPTTPAADEQLKASFPRPLADFEPFKMAQRGEAVQIADTETSSDARIQNIARARGFRSMLFAPLMGSGVPIGLISVTRLEPGSFAAHHVQLLQTFADQAVIAIENVRLFEQVQAKTRDLSESLQQQTATADVLKVISRSVFDLQTVFDTLVESAYKLCGASLGLLYLRGDEAFECRAVAGAGDAEVGLLFKGRPIHAGRGTAAERVILTGEVQSVTDFFTDPDINPRVREMIRNAGSGSAVGQLRSTLAVPMTRDDAVIGVIVIARSQTGPFPSRQVELLQTFADQAVIAIENARLFDEVQAKTRDLTEALTYQTGSSNILSVIASSPTDVEPVLEAIVESACTLCEADDAVVHLLEGDELRYAAHHGSIPVGLEKRSINRNFVTGRSVIDKMPIHLPDVLSAEGTEFPEAQEMSRRVGIRTLLSVPLLRENESIGAIMLRRTEVNPFNDKQIALLQNFADQAVIAIGNVRLFDEVQAKTRDLSEALQQQIATADVLKVISRSAFDLQTVLETLVRSAVELSGAKRGVIFLRDGDLFRFQAISYAAEASPEWVQFLRDNPQKAGRNSAIARAIASGEIVCVPDVLADPEINMPATALAGIRAVLAVPLLRDGKVEGIMALSRPTPGPFNARQIDLVQTFADQAVIAIENVRLFEEVQQRTRELAASLEELRTAQDRLVQTEKLASLGQLTAGIAHEIKNPLNFVNNFAAVSAELTDELNDVLASTALTDQIREDVGELTRMLKDNLERVVQHGKRADSIVKNMLLHSREGSGEHRPADINALLDESLNLAYHGARAEKPQFNVTLQRDFDAMAGIIELFPQEITRVLLNLISNGFYAVTKRKTENGDSAFEPVLSAATRNLGDAVEIRIRDNGTGIPAEVKEKMFNPFFTTKPAGEGTGLGLSMSHDIIVKQHGGRIDVETEPGEFTEFRIVLPRTGRLSSKE